MKRAVIIMTKVPRAGNVKTRLREVLAPAERVSLAEAFLRDAAAKAEKVCEDTIIAFFPPEESENLKLVLPAAKILAPQEGADLGERMRSAFDFAFARGFEEVVMIGTDSPTFPFDYLEQAFDYLETSSDAVLGKTDDGGFYLIGLRSARPEIFAGVAWSSPQTFEDVYQNISRLGLHLRETPGWYDVDEADDLNRLRTELAHNENARRRAPQTDLWMSRHPS